MTSAVALAVLERREQRRLTQAALLARSGWPVVGITVVAPGAEKDTATTRSLCADALAAVTRLAAERSWAIGEPAEAGGLAGPEALLAVDADPLELKRALVGLEDAGPRARLWDLDVLVAGAEGPEPVGRAALGEAPRRCFVCPEPAHACARNRSHHPLVLDAALAALASGNGVEESARWGGLAAEALRVEARLTPKPGLVDAARNGSHDDMDLALMLRSADALQEWFTALHLLGVSGTATTDSLVGLGVAAERAMMAETGGVNTHRGAIFLQGLAVSGAGAAAASDPGWGSADALAWVSRWGTEMLEGWRAAHGDPRSHGERAHALTGAGGARAEAASGFASVTTVALPAFRERLAVTRDEDAALRWALVHLMARVTDTNMITRGGVEGQRLVQAWASDLVSRQVGDAELVEELDRADAWFVQHRWSPGGSADLLALTWLLHRIETTDLS